MPVIMRINRNILLPQTSNILGALIESYTAPTVSLFMTHDCGATARWFMTDKSKEQLLSLQATADILGISTKTVRRLLDRREIAFVKVNRRVLVRLSDVEDFVKSRSVSKCEAEQIALEILERF